MLEVRHNRRTDMAIRLEFSQAARAAALADFRHRLMQKGIDWEEVPEKVAKAVKLCLGFAKGWLTYAPALDSEAASADRAMAEDLLRKVYRGKLLRVPGNKGRFLLVGGYVATEQEHLAMDARLSARPPKVR